MGYSYKKPTYSDPDKFVAQPKDPTFFSTLKDKVGKADYSDLGALLKPALNAANVLMQSRKLDDAYKKASQSIVPQLTAPVKPIAAIRDVPQELLAARTKEIGDMQSAYRGSDLVSDILSKSMLNQTKAQMMDKISAERSAHLVSENARVDALKAENQAAIVDTTNKQNALNAEEDRRIRDAGVQHDMAKKDLWSEAINQTVGSLDTAASYNATKHLKEQDATLNLIDKEIYENLELQRLRPYDTALKDKYNTLKTDRENLAKKALPTYNRFNAGAFGYKRGGKLIARTQ